MESEQHHKKISFSDWLKEYSSGLSLLFALIAIGIGAYNSYQIKNLVLTKDQANSGALQKPAVIEANRLKVLNELPKNTPYLGNPNAKLTMVEFADFQCPFCGRFQKETFPTLKKEYIDTGKVKFVYMDFAFLGQESKDAAEAANCAAEQGKFWQYHDEVFANQNGENQGNFNKINLEKFATNAGLNLDQFKSCVAQNKYDAQISASQKLGQKYGISGTPGFLIGKEFINGAAPLDNFEQVIDTELNG